MAIYRLEGVHKKTQRKRTRTYRTTTVDDAVKKASEESLIVDTSTIEQIFPVRHFFSKIVGVTYRNEDGSSRQTALKACRNGDQLGLLRDKGNKYSDTLSASSL